MADRNLDVALTVKTHLENAARDLDRLETRVFAREGPSPAPPGKVPSFPRKRESRGPETGASGQGRMTG